jgi:hypothetical protein
MRQVGLLAVLVAAGCASGGGAGGPEAGADDRQVVELTVVNRADGTVTAFAQWRTGSRTMLGVLRAGATGTYTTPYRGREVALTFDAGTPPPATGQPGSFAPAFVEVEPGEALVFEIIRIFPPDVFSRRAQR